MQSLLMNSLDAFNQLKEKKTERANYDGMIEKALQTLQQITNETKLRGSISIRNLLTGSIVAF